MATQKEIQNTIHDLMTATRTAKETKAELVQPHDEVMCGSMYKAVVVGFDLTETQWGKVKEFLTEKGHSTGAVNQIARFMAGNDGHIILTDELKDCEDTTVEGRIKWLMEKCKFPSFNKLKSHCLPVSIEAKINKIAKELAKMETADYLKCLDTADKLRMDDEASAQDNQNNVEAGKRHKMVTKKAVVQAMAVNS